VPGDDLLLLSNPSAFDGRRNLSIHYSLGGGVGEWGELCVVEDRGERGSSYAAMAALPRPRGGGAPLLGVLYSQDFHSRSLANPDPQLNTTFALLRFAAVKNDDNGSRAEAFKCHWNVAGQGLSSHPVAAQFRPFAAKFQSDVVIFGDDYPPELAGCLVGPDGGNVSKARWLANYQSCVGAHRGQLRVDVARLLRNQGATPPQLLVIDWESWGFSFAQSTRLAYLDPFERDWFALVQQLSSPTFNSSANRLAGFTPPRGSSGWEDLSAGQRRALAVGLFDALARDFVEQSIAVLRSVAKGFRLGFWDYPPRQIWPYVGANDDSIRRCAHGMDTNHSIADLNDGLGWLYKSVDLLLPDFYAVEYVCPDDGSAECHSCGNWSCGGTWTASRNRGLINGNLEEMRRIRAKFNPHAQLLPYVSWHLSSISRCSETRQNTTWLPGASASNGCDWRAGCRWVPPLEVKQQLELMVGGGANGIVFWGGSMDVPPKATADKINATSAYLEAVWGPEVDRYCGARKTDDELPRQASTAVVSPLQFGARFDGLTDDTDAWNLTVAAALNASSFGAEIAVPPGRSLLSRTLLVSLSGNIALSLRGSGSDVSELVWTEPVDGIVVEFKDGATNSRDAFATGAKFAFEGLSLIYGVPFVPHKTSAEASAGSVLHFASTDGIVVGAFVTSFVDAANVSLGTSVIAVTDTAVTLSANVSGHVPAGSELSFVRVGNSALTINGDSNQRFGLESPELYIRDTSIHGFTGGSLFTPGGSWLNGIVCNNQTAIRIDSAFITFGRELPVGVGVTIRGSYPTRLADDHHVTNLRTIAGDIGILLGGGRPGFEGLMLSDSSLVGPRRYGIWASTNHSIEDQLTVTGTHINAGHAALMVDGMTQVGISNCFFIVGAGAGGEVAALDFTDVGWFSITGNLMQLMPLSHSENSVWGIIVDNAKDWGGPSWAGTISGNVIQEPKTGGIWLKNHAANILVSGNAITTTGQGVLADASTTTTHFVSNMINGKLQLSEEELVPSRSQSSGFGVELPNIELISLPTRDVAVGTKAWVSDGCKPHEIATELHGTKPCTGVEAVFDSSGRWLRAYDYAAVETSGLRLKLDDGTPTVAATYMRSIFVVGGNAVAPIAAVSSHHKNEGSVRARMKNDEEDRAGGYPAQKLKVASTITMTLLNHYDDQRGNPLAHLPALPKVHYSWPFGPAWPKRDATDPLLLDCKCCVIQSFALV
jgi:hypothetical protein